MLWNAASLLWRIGLPAWSFLVATREPRVRRWRTAVYGHRLDPFTAFVRIGVDDVSPTVSIRHEALAARLTTRVLRATADMLNLRHDWMLGVDDRPYDRLLLDRSFAPLVRELVAWQSIGSAHALLAFRSSAKELGTDTDQRGVLVLMREVDACGEQPVFAFRPVASLHSWAEPVQRKLALRMIWAAWHLNFAVRGYDASRHQCNLLRTGTLFAGTIACDWGVGSWHPDDYVVRPSARAKGDDALVKSFHCDHADELRALSHRDLRVAVAHAQSM